MYELKCEAHLPLVRHLHTVVDFTPNIFPCFIYERDREGAKWTTDSIEAINSNQWQSYKNMVPIPYEKWSGTGVDSVKEQLTFAKSQVGKKIVSTSSIHGVVTGVSVETIEDYEKSYVGRRGAYTEEQQKSNDTHGVIVCLTGTWEANLGPATMKLPIYQGYTAFELPSINGFKCEDKGSYYQWGCAKIGTDTLLSARNFLSLSFENGCNRAPTSVKIGEGEFTLDILKRLNLD